MIITFSGHNGSGKSHVSKEVARELGYEWWGMGKLNREHAQELGLSIEAYDRLYEDDPSLDEERDEMVRRMGEERDEMVIDARAAWYFVEDSFDVFLTASDSERAKRLFSREELAENDFSSKEEALEVADERAERFRNRLVDLYGIDVYDPDNFDLVIDTTDMTPQEVVSKVLEAVTQL